MGESKMTNVLVSTEKFIATLTFPVKNKITEAISKKQTRTYESTDAVIEVMPVMHTVVKEKQKDSLVFRFFTLLTFPASSLGTKHKQAAIQELIDAADDKMRYALKELEIAVTYLASIKADRCIVNLLDKSGKDIVQSVIISIGDVQAALHAIHTKLLLQPPQKKLSPLFITHAEQEAPKPRRKEKAVSKEGGQRRYFAGTTSNPK
ncbi:MAG TPA: hypothetical protein VN457_01480 [Chlamydiales bacterium]|nr:hypothetical protein [Chlamydiales bacterium]